MQEDLQRPKPDSCARLLDHNPSVNAKLTTNDGISVTFQTKISTQEAEEGYLQFLRPYGQVLLDPDLDLEPQILREEDSPVYSEIYDSFGNVIQENYPSSWDESSEMPRANEVNKTQWTNQEDPWSDIGQPVNSSFEFWKAKNKLKAVSKPKLFDTKYQHNNKYASDSNINDAVDMTEPGLRKITKEPFTTSSETEHHYYSINEDLDVKEEDDNIYESVEFPEESGFFSMQQNNVTCIPVNQQPTSSSSDEYASCKVTVNGKLWINPKDQAAFPVPKHESLFFPSVLFTIFLVGYFRKSDFD